MACAVTCSAAAAPASCLVTWFRVNCAADSLPLASIPASTLSFYCFSTSDSLPSSYSSALAISQPTHWHSTHISMIFHSPVSPCFYSSLSHYFSLVYSLIWYQYDKSGSEASGRRFSRELIEIFTMEASFVLGFVAGYCLFLVVGVEVEALWKPEILEAISK